MSKVQCRVCGSKNCNRTHQNIKVLPSGKTKKEYADVHRCGDCFNVQHEQPTQPITEADCGQPLAGREPLNPKPLLQGQF